MSERVSHLESSYSSVIKLNRIAIFALLCGVLVSLASKSSAQVLYGSITGTVTDPSGAAVSGAKVEALDVGKGVAQETATDLNGIYRFGALLPGIYKVTVSIVGFETQVTPGVHVAGNEVARVDARLKIAAATQNVTVTAEAPLLQTDKADVHSDLTSREVDELPSAGSQGRNFQSLLQLIPGAGLTSETNSLAGNPERAMNTNVNGQSNQSVNTRIDGVQDAYPWLPANVAYVPPSDAIQEVNIVTNSFDAEQGMAGGAAVNVQIKSGTNKFHGSGDWFHTDQNFAALNYFSRPGTTINRNNQNQFGGTFGGPIKKDKLFFFGDYERTTQRGKAGPDTRTLPTPAMASGDFSNLPGNPVIYDPATGDAHGAGKQQISCNGVLNVICPNRIDPASAALLQLLQPSIAQEVGPNNLGLNNFFGSGTALFNRDNADIKINYVPTQKSMVWGRYSLSRILVFDPPLLGDAGGDATNGGQLGNAPGLIQSVGLGATYSFAPNLLFDWNFGYTRQRLGASFDLGSPKGLDLLKIPGTNGAGVPAANYLYNGLPAFQINSSAASLNIGNPNTGNPYLFRDNQFVSGANLSWTRGRHNLRGGIEWNHTQINHFQPQGGSFQTARGSFLFNGDVTSLPGTTPTYFNSFADFLLGLPSQTGKAYLLFNPVALRWNQWAWYVRDQWQVTPKLTLNLGVRWEYYPFGYSDNGKGLRWLNPAEGNVFLGGYGSVPQNDGVDVGSGRFLPRLGAAYRLTKSTVIRAGYGMSLDPNNWRYFRNAYPAAVVSNNVNPTANTKDFTPAASLTGTNGTGLGANDLNGPYSVKTGLVLIPPPNISTGVVPLPTNAGTTTVPSPFDRGYINSFNLTVEQEFKGFVFQTGYVGAHDIRPLVNMNLNASLPGTGQAGGLLSQALGKTYTATINGEVPFKSNSYNSLQTKVTRRLAQGSTFGAVWTWSRALDYSDDEELNFLLFPHPAYWQKDYAPAAFDRTHDVEIYGVLNVPFGTGQRWAKQGFSSWILGGWQISPTVSMMTGLPFTVTGNGSALGANGSTQTADLVGPFHLTGGQPPTPNATCKATDLTCHYFDPTAFAEPNPPGTPPQNLRYGNTGRGAFRGPGYFNMNLSLARQFKITERIGLQFRADAIHFTNTPHFNNPNASCGATVTNPSCTATNPNFGVITSTLSPPGQGFFGNDSGSRVLWLGARVTF
ncbi:MAG TPA: TonB-dependent receptor [Candidatus Acidoferrum sp.]|nr:TonB-dependent receptor [Candidatus Acidoferrum sp.]